MAVLDDRDSPGHADMRGKDGIVGVWLTGRHHGFDANRMRFDDGCVAA